VRGKGSAAVQHPVDPLLRATVALCGGLVVATPLFFAAALLHAALAARSFAGELWLLGLWGLAAGGLALFEHPRVAVTCALLATGAACLAAVLARALVAGALPLDPASWSVNAGFAAAGAAALAAGALLRRGSGGLWSE